MTFKISLLFVIDIINSYRLSVFLFAEAISREHSYSFPLHHDDVGRSLLMHRASLNGFIAETGDYKWCVGQPTDFHQSLAQQLGPSCQCWVPNVPFHHRQVMPACSWNRWWQLRAAMPLSVDQGGCSLTCLLCASLKSFAPAAFCVTPGGTCQCTEREDFNVTKPQHSACTAVLWCRHYTLTLTGETPCSSCCLLTSCRRPARGAATLHKSNHKLVLY